VELDTVNVPIVGWTTFRDGPCCNKWIKIDQIADCNLSTVAVKC